MATYNFQNGHEEVVQQLNELFGNSLNLNIIKSVAKSCKFDVEQSSLQLLEITNQPNTAPAPTMNNLKINPFAMKVEPKKSKKLSDIESAIEKINAGYKVLILLRGLPGSGKSTLAKIILKNTIGYNNETAQKHILSTDDFFMKNGVYQHDARQLSEAHGWNHQRAFNVMCKGYSPVIIDNTNTQMWEMKPYAMMATDYGYFLEILEPDTHWCFNEKELAKRNNHDVPRATIKNMIERYHKNVTPMKLLTAYDCKYKLQKPPQFRLYPPISCQPARPIDFTFKLPKPVTYPKKKSPAKIPPLKLYTVENKTDHAVEAINLMDFSEPDVPSVPFKQTKKPNFVASTNEGSVSVDNLLMYDDGTSLKSTILSPTPPVTKMKQSTSLFDNMKNAWGVDETALRSWDIVTPLKENTSKNVEIIEVDDDPVVETTEMSTSTDDEDFYILRNVLDYVSSKNVKVLTTCNRDINRYAAVQLRVVPKKLMLDKSCLTEDYFDDQNLHIEHLTNVFQDIDIKTLKYWYNKCNRDFECTIELLLNEREEVISVVLEDEENESVTVPDKPQEVLLVDSDSGSSSSNEAPDSDPKPHKHKRKNNSSSSDESQQLKKCIESKVTISSDHYSEKLLKVRQQKFGEQPSSSSAPQPGTSSALKPNSPTYEVPVEMDFEFVPEFDDFEWEETSSPEQNQNDYLETVELNLGDNFVKQLEDRFGDPNLSYPKGFQPVVQVPVALARQLYTFYIESVYQQMDAQKSVLEDLMKEDEEFARNLQEKEEEAAKFAVQRSKSQEECAQLPDIIKEQKELSKWQKEVDKWKELTPDTLAAKLTRDKLFNVFPSLNRDTLVEILQAHDNVYQDTVETLLASTNFDDVRGHMDSIKDPPINQTMITEMWKDHESCHETEDTNAVRTAEAYREEANRFLKKRSDLYEKAQRYNQSGMKEVAQFYSSLAAQQTKLYEKANSFATTAILDEHSKRLQDFNTLDLHRLYVKESIPALDVFLDRNINLLRLSSSKNTEFLQIITGRGKNSPNGVAKIRPVVIHRLKQRKITYQQLNPGLLKIRITKNSLVTSEL